MDEITQTEKDQVYELVSSQKKAKLEWVSTIIKIPVEKIINCADEMGLIIDGDFITVPHQKEDVSFEELDKQYEVLKPKKEIKIRRGVFLALSIIGEIISPLSMFFSIITILCLVPGIEPWGLAVCVIWSLLSLVIFILGFIYIIRRIKNASYS